MKPRLIVSVAHKSTDVLMEIYEKEILPRFAKRRLSREDREKIEYFPCSIERIYNDLQEGTFGYDSPRKSDFEFWRQISENHDADVMLQFYDWTDPRNSHVSHFVSGKLDEPFSSEATEMKRRSLSRIIEKQRSFPGRDRDLSIQHDKHSEV